MEQPSMSAQDSPSKENKVEDFVGDEVCARFNTDPSTPPIEIEGDFGSVFLSIPDAFELCNWLSRVLNK